MKRPQPTSNDGTTPEENFSSLRVWRRLEQELGVYFGEPNMPRMRGPEQQLGVYDEDEVYVGDIYSSSRYFTVSEARRKVHDLWRVETVAASERFALDR